jgi:uncharacterized membrane protein
MKNPTPLHSLSLSLSSHYEYVCVFYVGSAAACLLMCSVFLLFLCYSQCYRPSVHTLCSFFFFFLPFFVVVVARVLLLFFFFFKKTKTTPSNNNNNNNNDKKEKLQHARAQIVFWSKYEK